MSFGKPGTMHDWTLDEEGTDAVVAHALDLGITFFDTANGYSAGTSEEYLGKALRKHTSRDRVVIASKVYFNEGRLSSKAIHREIDGTLKRLGTDYLDLYIIHRFDYGTPIEKTMEALNDLVQVGKVRALGAPAMYASQFQDMQKVRPRQQLDPLQRHGEPLQPALPGGREGPDAFLQKDGCIADALKPSGCRPSDTAHLDRRHPAQRNRQGLARQVRPGRRQRPGHHRPRAESGRRTQCSYGPGSHSLAVGQRRCLTNHRSHQGPAS